MDSFYHSAWYPLYKFPVEIRAWRATYFTIIFETI
ncbi:hypothetical protein SAMN05518847_101823 [Paenibacillus sp. OV219]|nr:hypothetical protein SAMN05518847_101823 [Paenibacillus sp. OV219]